MATLLAHIKVRPGSEARFEEIAAELHKSTHADETNVRRYEFWRGAEPGTYYCLESFDSDLGFLVHQTSDHHEAASPPLGEVIEEIRLEWVDPIQSASPLAPTNRSPLPSQATPLEAEYHEKYPVEVQDWWQNLREG